jgi:hypothetical protein
MAKIAKREIGMSAIRGSCLCGGVKFEITGPLSSPLNCHCSQCRKQHGAPFRSRILRNTRRRAKTSRVRDQVQADNQSQGGCQAPVAERPQRSRLYG